MRIIEVTRQNRTWAKLSGVDLTIDTSYHGLIHLMKLIIATASRYRASQIIDTIDEFEQQLGILLQLDVSLYPDPSDMNIFKKKCNKMLKNIQYLKSKLP